MMSEPARDGTAADGGRRPTAAGGPAVRRFRAMGGPCEIWLEGSAATVDAAAQAAQAEVQRIEATFSRYRPDSVVSRLNAAAGSGQGLPVDDETAALLNFCAVLHEQSGGLFDATSGVLRRAWDFRSGRLPSDAEVCRWLPLVGWQHVRWDGRVCELTREGMELDFGGIGKEYAADRAGTLLQAMGLRHGWVDLAGDIRVLGPRSDGLDWRFGIRHPRRPDGVLAEVALAAGGLATSGDYERFLEHAGRRYCHILDPRTGWPVRHWQSVSVVAPTCVAAGALATVAMLRGADAPAFLEAQGVAYLAVDAQGRRYEGAPGA